MGIVFITPRHEHDGFEYYLGTSLSNIKTKCINVADKADSDKPKTISTKYNIGINIAKEQGLLEDDTIIVLAKSNVHILDTEFTNKIQMIFDSKPSVGIVGVVGVRELHRGRALYDNDNSPLNSIIYTIDRENDKGEHVQYSKNGFYNDIVAVDDSLIAIRGSLLNTEHDFFDFESDVSYGIEASIKAMRSGFDVSVADILVVSEDNTNYTADVSEKMVDQLGLEFPVNIKTAGGTFNSVVELEL